MPHHSWEGEESPKPSYHTVIVSDADGNCASLLSGEAFTLFEELIRPPVSYSSYRGEYTPPRSRSDIKKGYEQQTGLNIITPVNNSMAVSEQALRMLIFSKTAPEDCEPWRFLCSSGLKASCLFSRRFHKPGADHAQHAYKIRLELEDKIEGGYVTFMQAAKAGATLRGCELPYGELMTLFVFRSQAVLEKYTTYPPVINVMPTVRYSYVPLKTMQWMQVFLPDDCEIISDIGQSGSYPVQHGKSFKLPYRNFVAHSFRATRVLTEQVSIDFQRRGTDQRGSVVVCPVNHSGASPTGIITNPPDSFTLYANNIGGITIRTQGDCWNSRHVLDKGTRHMPIQGKNYTDTGMHKMMFNCHVGLREVGDVARCPKILVRNLYSPEKTNVVVQPGPC